MTAYPYTIAKTDPDFNNYITKRIGTYINACDFLKNNTNKKLKKFYNDVVLKLQRGIAFSSSDEPVLKEFAYTKVFQCDSNINTSCVKKIAASSNLNTLFNIIRIANNGYHDFITKQTLIPRPDLHLMNLFSIIKHCQDPNSYPIRYLQWVNLNEHCKWSTVGADDYERLCDLYRNIPSLTDAPRHLYFAAYMDKLARDLAKTLAPNITSYDPKDLKKIVKIFNTKDCDNILGITRDKDGTVRIATSSTHTGTSSGGAGKGDEIPSNPLNLILYGPPGTGKTYNTLFHALAIINNKSIDDLIGEKISGKSSKDNLTKEEYKLFKKDFDEKVETGQIVFTTFHQSMCYEDFIEGIKPEPVNDKITAIHENDVKSATTITQFGDGKTTIENLSRMKYDVKNGVFKGLCDKALAPNILLEFEVAYKYLKNDVSSKRKVSTKGYSLSISESGNILVDSKSVSQDNLKLYYDYFQENGWEECEKNRTDKKWWDNKIAVLTENKTNHVDYTYYYALLSELSMYKPRFVLIIDEINRGNVAQIFGELITLIEPSKRLGNSEEMKAILPYSSAQKGEPVYFGVPNNLYIIGTMNTADRSVEALDTALRRRFSFEEMMPKPELLGDKELCDVKLSDLMTTINQRIVALKDREHQIGHSYFMGCPDDEAEAKIWLTNVFKDKIIPLLQEYFYGDYKKIYYVLGEEFVREVAENKSDIFSVEIDDDLDENMSRYEIKSFDEKAEIDNKIDIVKAVQSLTKSVNVKKKEKRRDQLKEKGYKAEDIEKILNGESESNFKPE